MAFLEALLVRFSEYLPAFVRVSSFLLAAPIFGQGVPPLAKLGLAGITTLLILPVVPAPQLPQDLGGYALAVVEEVAVGLAMGSIVSAVVAAFYLAGQWIDIPLGFGAVNIIDPQSGTELPIMAQFQYVLAILVFFLVDGHHELLRALARSFAEVPAGTAAMSGAVVEVAVRSFGAMFLLALRIALPVIAALFLTDVGLGIIARAVPQLNVFFVGFPLKIAVGIAVVVVVLPVYVALVAWVFGSSGELVGLLAALVRAMRGAP